MQHMSQRATAVNTDEPSSGRARSAARSWQDAHVHPNKDHQFVAMLDAYRDSGGLATCPELLASCRRHCGADVGTVARWIVERTVVCFDWRSQTWFPLFQFHGTDFAPSLRLRPLLNKLSDQYDRWDVARWFVSPNLHLGGRLPVSLLDADLCAVLCAAQPIRSPDEMPGLPPPTR